MNGLTALPNTARSQGSPERRERLGRVETSVATPFDALLDATRQNVRARTLEKIRESPEQMFEAQNVDARQQRKEALQDADSPIEQPSVTKDAKEPPASRHAPADADPRREPTSTGRESSFRGAATERGSAPSTRDTGMPSSPTHQATVPPKAVEAAAQRNSPDNGPDRGDATPLNAVNASSHDGAPAAASATVATPPAAGGGEQTVARSLGEALGAKAVNEVAGPQSTMATPARSADEKSAAPQTAQAKRSAETAPSPQPTTTETDPTLSPFERLVRSIRLNIGERFSTARMELDPPELGRMHVEVHMRGDAVELEVRTSNEAARELVAGRADELRLALEQHGVQVQRFDVVVEGPMVGPRRRADDTEKSARRRDDGSKGERAELRRVLSRVGRLDVRV